MLIDGVVGTFDRWVSLVSLERVHFATEYHQGLCHYHDNQFTKLFTPSKDIKEATSLIPTFKWFKIFTRKSWGGRVEGAMQEQSLIKAAQRVVFRLFKSNKPFDSRALLALPMLMNDDTLDPSLQRAIKRFSSAFLNSPEQSQEAWFQYLQAFTKWNDEIF